MNCQCFECTPICSNDKEGKTTIKVNISWFKQEQFRPLDKAFL